MNKILKCLSSLKKCEHKIVKWKTNVYKISKNIFSSYSYNLKTKETIRNDYNLAKKKFYRKSKYKNNKVYKYALF